MNDVFCAEASQAAGEALLGTAGASTRSWLLLEYDDAWASKPLPPSRLPAEVKTHIERFTNDVSGSRFQFIRRPGRDSSSPILYVGSSQDRDPWLLRFELASYEQILDFDFGGVLERGYHPAGQAVRQPLYLVCTHGKRDPCCAKFGVPVYEAFVAYAPESVWQTSHVGGHRFAGNVIGFPHGINYGRVIPEDAAGMVDAHRAGDFFAFEKVRGRTAYDPAAQVAEVALRRALGRSDLGGLWWVETRRDEHRFGVDFEDDVGNRYTLDVVSEEREATRPPSCGDAPEVVIDYRVLVSD